MKNKDEIPVEKSKPHESVIYKFCNCFTYVIVAVIISIVILFTSCGIILNCMFPDAPSERKIDKIVNKNKEEILSSIKDGTVNNLKIDKVKGIQSKDDDSIIEFYCGSSGIMDLIDESGFYYSKADKPVAMLNFPDELKETSEGCWEYTDDDDSGAYYITDKICDDFYYYYGYYGNDD